MLEYRHNTHALSSFNSSSNNHSYDFENKGKLDKNIKPTNIKENITQLTNVQINKVNDILNKYNLISERSSNKEDKSISIIKIKLKKKATNSDIQLSPRLKKKKNNSSSSFLNEINNKNISSNKDKTIDDFGLNNNNKVTVQNLILNQKIYYLIKIILEKLDLIIYKNISTKKTKSNRN